MIKMLIVEDEEIMRDGLLEMMDWRHIDIVPVGCAANGTEGLALIEEESPDLVITDIRMPHMDGLEMIKQAQQRGYAFETIILSGYNDFQYARQGIALGISDYVLKPCRPQDMTKAIQRVLEKIQTTTRQSMQMERLQSTLDRNISYALEQTLSQWCHYSNKPLENRSKVLKELSIPLAYESVHAGIVKLEFQEVEPAIPDGEKELLRYAANNIISETLSSVYNSRIVAFREDQSIIWIGNCSSPMHKGEVEQTLKKLLQNLSSFLKIPCTIGVGETQATVEMIQLSYQQAQKALENRFFGGIGQIYWYKPEQPDSATDIWSDAQSAELEKSITHALQIGNYALALDEVERWLEYMKSTMVHHRDEMQLKATALILELKTVTEKLPNAFFSWKNTMVNWSEQLPSIQTFDELSAIIKKIVRNIVETMKTETSLHRTVQAALSVIHGKYDTNLSLDSVARETFVSSSYLSSLFKQELGVNFLDYLHQYRIEQAKGLLDQQLKVYAVARQVGYQDEKHFSTTFKKWTGLTPTQYQKR